MSGTMKRIGGWIALGGFGLLAGCGGGGGGGGGSSGDVAAPAPAPAPAPQGLTLAAACNRGSDANCAALDARTYSGSGIGIWTASAGTSAAALNFTVDNTAGKTVTLVWTNTSGSSQSGTGSVADVIAGDSADAAARLQAALARDREKVREAFANPAQLAAHMNFSSGIHAAYVAGTTTRSWHETINNKDIATTLRKQVPLSNGQNLNIWVQDSEWTSTGESNKVDQARVDTLASEFAAAGSGIFDLATAIAGKPWGATKYGNVIGEAQDINIVAANITADGKAGGLVGYFNSLNNVLKATGPKYANSNEALMFVIDTETLASSQKYYQDEMVSVLEHEFTHMINFYQRYVLNRVEFDTWLEEVSAMMMQSLLDPVILSGFDDVRDSRMPGWYASGINNCSLTAYTSSTASGCFSYSIGASYGAYLLRQYGLEFYQRLLKSTEPDSIAALDASIRASDPAASFATSVARWGAAIALLDSSKLPAGFGYPARGVSVGGQSWTLPAFNGPDYATVRKIAPTLPTTLNAYAHAAQTFAAGGGFSRKLAIPANTTLTVVVN